MKNNTLTFIEYIDNFDLDLFCKDLLKINSQKYIILSNQLLNIIYFGEDGNKNKYLYIKFKNLLKKLDIDYEILNYRDIYYLEDQTFFKTIYNENKKNIKCFKIKKEDFKDIINSFKLKELKGLSYIKQINLSLDTILTLFSIYLSDPIKYIKIDPYNLLAESINES